MALIARIKAETGAFWRGFLAEGRLARLALAAGAALLATILFDIVLAKLTGWSVWSVFAEWLKQWDHAWSDSWRPMNAALDLWRAEPQALLYQKLFFEQGVKFQYPPSSLLPWAAFEAIGFPRDYISLNWLNRVFVLINAAAVGALSWLLMGRWSEPAPPRARMLIALLTGIACLFFYPIMKGWHLGQIQVWINAAFALACIAWLLDKRVAAGVLIACITLLKPQFGLFFLWALARRDWRFIAGFAGFGGVMGLISLALFGLANHLDYLKLLSELSRHGESYFANQSVNGLLHRMLHNGPNLEFEASALPPYNAFVHGATLISSALLTGLALWPVKHRDALFDFMLAALCFTMASPIAWEHHYGVIAPMLAALFCRLALRSDASSRDWMLFGLCFVATSMSLSFLDAAANTPFNFVQSYLFFGALGILAMLWRARQERAAQRSA
jgi:hypothetical protein